MAYYCLHKLHRWPHEFLSLDRYEKAFVIAAVLMKQENDRKEMERSRRKR